MHARNARHGREAAPKEARLREQRFTELEKALNKPERAELRAYIMRRIILQIKDIHDLI